MDNTTKNKTIVGGAAFLCLAALVYLITSGSPYQLEKRVPGMDNADEALASSGSREGPDGELIPGNGEPADIPGSWLCFRGRDLDNIVEEDITPIKKGEPFPVHWKIEVGEGFAGPVIWNGRVYLIDYDRDNKQDAIRCLSFADGKEIWRYVYPVNVKRNHGMSRTVPTMTDDVVITMGPKGHVTCLDSLSGEKKWSLDLRFAYQAVIPPWYAGQCPLLDDGKLILAPGGSALLIAVDPLTGEVIWESPNPRAWKMTHSSVMPMQFNGQRMYVYCASGGVVGVSAETGEILWQTDEWTIKMANVPSPLMIGDGRIFFCGGYSAGSMMLELQEGAEGIEPKILYRLEEDVFGSTQHTPILHNNHIYGTRPDGEFVCLDLDGNVVWTSTSTYKFGLGAYIMADDLFYVLDDSGLLSRIGVSADSFDLMDQSQILEGHDSWGPIAYASGRMIMRDMTQMICIQVAAE